MPNSKIIKEVISNSISLNEALDRLLVIAIKLGDSETANWAEREKNGYSNSDTLPPYRTIIDKNCRYPITSGIFQLSASYKIYKTDDLQKCPLILECAVSDENAIKKSGCKNCIRIEKFFEIVKTEFIKNAVKLEKNFGSLDTYDIQNNIDLKEDYDLTVIEKVIEKMNNNEKNTININITNNGGKISNFANSTKKEKTTTNNINAQTNVAVNKKDNWFTKFLRLFKRKKK